MAIYHVAARYEVRGRSRLVSFVLKGVRGRARREGAILKALARSCHDGIVPRLLGIIEGETETYLALEPISRATAWPWRSLELTSRVMLHLGRFYASRSFSQPFLDDWDYECEVASTARDTVQQLASLRGDPDYLPLTRHLRTIERLADNLPRLRRALFEADPLGARQIHGDVHPGNAMIRGGRHGRPVLIDWGRARMGSPLEDVSSMLQSLRFYEPAALRRHDTLLKDYLTGIGLDRRIGDDLRGAYWTAGASNAFAGALNVHLMAATDVSVSSRHRGHAFAAASEWIRIVRRAYAWSS